MSVREQLRRMQEHPEFLERLKASPEAQEVWAELVRVQESNPLLMFEPHPPGQDGRRPQLEFIEARTPVIVAQAGNQFGKSTILTVCGLRETLPKEALPPLLQRTKRFEAPTHGWIMVPTEAKIFDAGGFQEVIERWVPAEELQGGSWGKAFNGSRLTLTLKCGSTISFKTYQQDPSTLGGATLHWVGYDEPPPRKHREEGMTRLLRHNGFEMFAFTPLQTNTGWLRRDIYKNRESPDITLVRGSMRDNVTLSKEAVERTLASYGSDLWRRARETGEFIDVGGMIYPQFNECLASKPWSLEFIRTLDVVVGIDPGIRNCGLVWVGFDRDLTAHVFYSELLQDKTAAQYVEHIKAVNARLGLRNVSYVVDPAAKQRAQANGMTVLSEINKADVYPNLGQNDHELGFGQMRTRMAAAPKRFLVSPGPECMGLRDEADDYAAKEPEEGRDDSHLEPIKGNDHRMDALRYAVMERFWDPVMEAQAPGRNLGWSPDHTVDVAALVGQAPKQYGPMGMLS